MHGSIGALQYIHRREAALDTRFFHKGSGVEYRVKLCSRWCGKEYGFI